MIEVRNLTKSYGPRLAIDHLNFSVRKGEVVGFLGPNGAGKSTTMKIITGFMAPSEGTVLVDGLDVFENPIEVKKRIGYLPEVPPVYGDMFVEDYLKYAALLKQVPRKKVSAMVEQALEKTGLQDVRKRMIQNLSKGFRQRVGIAQAIVSDPEILILDEPTVGLDPKQVAEIRELIRSLKGQHTIVLSTHILPEVQANCEHIIIINKGHIVAEDSLEDLTAKLSGGQRYRVRVQSRPASFEESLKSVEGVKNVRSQGDTLHVTLESEGAVVGLSEFIVKSGAGLLELSPENVGLEDIFIQLTSEEQQTSVGG